MAGRGAGNVQELVGGLLMNVLLQGGGGAAGTGPAGSRSVTQDTQPASDDSLLLHCGPHRLEEEQQLDETLLDESSRDVCASVYDQDDFPDELLPSPMTLAITVVNARPALGHLGGHGRGHGRLLRTGLMLVAQVMPVKPLKPVAWQRTTLLPRTPGSPRALSRALARPRALSQSQPPLLQTLWLPALLVTRHCQQLCCRRLSPLSPCSHNMTNMTRIGKRYAHSARRC